MKKVTRLFCLLTFSIFLCAGYPVMAQDNEPATTSQTSPERDDDTGKWGLAGLLGLLGLLGLKRRDDRDRRASVNR